MIKFRHTTAAAFAAAALTFGAVSACEEEVGEKKTGQEVPAAEEGVKPPADTPAEKADPVPAESEEQDDGSVEEGQVDRKKDVTIKSCRVLDPYDDDVVDRHIAVDVSVKNSSTVVSDYLYEIEATDVKGNRIEMMLGSATKVSPGQTVDTSGTADGSDEEDALSSPLLKGVTLDKCQLVSVDAYPSTD